MEPEVPLTGPPPPQEYDEVEQEELQAGAAAPDVVGAAEEAEADAPAWELPADDDRPETAAVVDTVVDSLLLSDALPLDEGPDSSEAESADADGESQLWGAAAAAAAAGADTTAPPQPAEPLEGAVTASVQFERELLQLIAAAPPPADDDEVDAPPYGGSGELPAHEDGGKELAAAEDVSWDEDGAATLDAHARAAGGGSWPAEPWPTEAEAALEPQLPLGEEEEEEAASGGEQEQQEEAAAYALEAEAEAELVEDDVEGGSGMAAWDSGDGGTAAASWADDALSSGGAAAAVVTSSATETSAATSRGWTPVLVAPAVEGGEPQVVWQPDPLDEEEESEAAEEGAGAASVEAGADHEPAPAYYHSDGDGDGDEAYAAAQAEADAEARAAAVATAAGGGWRDEWDAVFEGEPGASDDDNDSADVAAAKASLDYEVYTNALAPRSSNQRGFWDEHRRPPSALVRRDARQPTLVRRRP